MRVSNVFSVQRISQKGLQTPPTKAIYKGTYYIPRLHTKATYQGYIPRLQESDLGLDLESDLEFSLESEPE